MIRLILIAGVLVLVFSGINMAAEEGLVAYYPFDEGTGQAIKDTSGNGHDGKIIGTAKWVDGKHGKAIEFDGKTSYVEVPDAADFAIQTDVTFTVWFKPNVTINAANNAYRMMSKNNDVFFLFNYEKLGQLGFLVKDPAGANHAVHSTTAEWTSGIWYHVAGTFDGKELKIYINGKLEATMAYEGKIGTSKLALWIGADDYPNYFPGAIDDVRIYKRTLNASDVNGAMELPPSAIQPSSGSVTTMWGKIKL